jgi:hypothetical protein
MTAVGDGSLNQGTDARLGRLAVGVIAPLAVVAAACALWWVSDRLVVIGPLDRAAFGWVVVIPVWLSAPIVAAFAWGGLGRLDTRIAAILVGVIVSAVASTSFWQSVSTPACEYGATHTPADWLIPSLVVGLVVGGGLVVSSLLAATQIRRGHPWRTVVVGAGAESGFVFVAILVAVSMLLGPGCQRPPV